VIWDRVIDWLAAGLCWVFGHDRAVGRTWCVYCGKDLT
jgi:hypothetical protein